MVMHTTTLCTPVTWNVGKYSPAKFYKQLMLDGSIGYAKFPFEEMKLIYHQYIGMDYWPLLTETLCTEHKVELTDTFCLISLVSVTAFNCLSPRQWGRDKADKAGMALKEIRKLYEKFFTSKDEKSY